jgi:molybdopterin converting factor small subunit
MSMLDIRYIAGLSECLGQSREQINAVGPQSVDGIVALRVARGEPWQTQFSGKIPVLVAVNRQMATSESAVQSNEEIAFSHQSRVVNELQVRR